MKSKGFSELEKDAIGEILNISHGASATAASTMLNARVDITTPVVSVVSKDEFEFSNLEPAVAVEITYVSGLKGNNIMLLKKWDVKIIVEMLMGTEIPDDEFELDEMNISAICEVMNQMMGASSTALSEFLDKAVNISPPTSFEIKNEAAFKDKYFTEDNGEPMVVIGFTLKIGDKLESEFINVMPPELAKGLVAGFFPEGQELLEAEDAASTMASEDGLQQEEAEESGGSQMLSQEEIERMILASAAETPPVQQEPVQQVPTQQVQSQPDQTQQMQPQPDQTQQVQPQPDQTQQMQPQLAPNQQVQPQMVPVQGIQPQADMGNMQAQMAMQQQMLQMMQQMQQMQQQIQQQKAAPKVVHAKPSIKPNLTQDDIVDDMQEENMELILGVPLEVSVEIGRTKKLVKDILDFSKGSLVVLDKLAGEQVDLFVNGRCIAKGDVVVVEDNFGIRITEIVKKNIVAE